MNEAYIYDAIRTPRGKGKHTGSLHQISPVKLAAKTLKEMGFDKVSHVQGGFFSMKNSGFKIE